MKVWVISSVFLQQQN